jgi:hypothetical protein
MGRRSVVEEGSTYDVVSDKEAPEGGWGWMAAFGLALLLVSTKEIYYYVNLIVFGQNC